MTAGAEAAIAAATAANASAAADAAAITAAAVAGSGTAEATAVADTAASADIDATAAAARSLPSPATSTPGSCVDEVASAKPTMLPPPPAAVAAAGATTAAETPAAAVTPPHPPPTVSVQAVAASLPGSASNLQQWQQEEQQRRFQPTPTPPAAGTGMPEKSPCSSEGHELPAAAAAAAASGGSAVAGTAGAEPVAQAAPSMATGGGVTDSAALLAPEQQSGALSFQARVEQHRRASVSPATVSAIDVPAWCPAAPLAVPLSAFSGLRHSPRTVSAVGRNFELRSWGGGATAGRANNNGEKLAAAPGAGGAGAAADAGLAGGLRKDREPLSLQGSASALEQPSVGVVGAGDGGNGTGQVPIGGAPWRMPATAAETGSQGASPPRAAGALPRPGGDVAGDGGNNGQLLSGGAAWRSPYQAAGKGSANPLPNGGGVSWHPMGASCGADARLPQRGAGLQAADDGGGAYGAHGGTPWQPHGETEHTIGATLPWQTTRFGQAGGGTGAGGVSAEGLAGGGSSGSGRAQGGSAPGADLQGVGVLQDEGDGREDGGDGVAAPNGVVFPRSRPGGGQPETQVFYVGI